MAFYHARTNSLPSKQHPLITEFDEQLSKLRSSQETSSSSSTSITLKLTGLQDLLDFVDQLISLPRNQQAMSQVDEVLDGSLRLLDLCNAAKDALSQAKESGQEIQSILRRRRVGDVSLTSGVNGFLVSKKLAKKALHKVMELNKGRFKPLQQENSEIVGVLREVETTTLEAFESLFSFISGSRKSRGWSSVSKLIMSSKRVVCEEVNGFESVEAALKSLVSQKLNKSDNKIEERVQNELQKFEMRIRDLEEGIESLYRRLIKTRVSLLDIINH